MRTRHQSMEVTRSDRIKMTRTTRRTARWVRDVKQNNIDVIDGGSQTVQN